MPIINPIEAYLHEKYSTDGGSNTYMGRAANGRTLNVRQVCESAVGHGRSDVSADAMQHAVEMFFKEMGDSLCSGYKVDAGWFSVEPEIRGLFGAPDETFDREKHSVLFRFHQGEKLRAGVSGIGVDVLGLYDGPPTIVQVTDLKSGSVNDLLTPGCNLSVLGSKINVSESDPANGIFFFNTITQIRTEVKPSDITTNSPSELEFVIPKLVPGEYILEVATQFSPDALLEEPFTAVFDRILSVEKGKGVSCD